MRPRRRHLRFAPAKSLGRWSCMGIAALGLGNVYLACSHDEELFPEASPHAIADASGGVDVFVDAKVTSWGSFAATVPGIAPCATEPKQRVLLVNTTLDELDAPDGTSLDDPAKAGPLLSLREAMWIATNRAGPDTILFDEQVFSADNPATIEMRGEGMPADASDFCIDARGRGVVIGGAQNTQTPRWNLGAGSRILGATLLWPANGWNLGRGAQMAVCRVGTDGYMHLTQAEVALNEAELGPGNVFLGYAYVRHFNSATIRGNDFGMDPLSGVLIPVKNPILLWNASLLVEQNRFAVQGSAVRTVLPFPIADASSGTTLGSVTFRNNRLNCDSDAGDLLSRTAFETSSVYMRLVLGPGNVIRGKGAVVVAPSGMHVTRNSISGDDAGTRAMPTTAVAAPVIRSIDGGLVEGTCARPGLIEVFADPSAEGETYLGTSSCDASTWQFRLPDAAPAPGGNITATLTEPGPAGPHTSAFSKAVRMP